MIFDDQRPLVSIFCLTYNHSKFIKDALDGFLMQKTNFPYEIVIYDDCSTDNNKEIIREYMDKHPDKVRAFLSDVNHFTKGPKYFFLYKFIEMARGQYVAICEGDDYWIDPYKLQKQVNLFQENPGMTYCFSRRAVRNEITGQERLECHFDKKYLLKDFLSGFNPGLQTVMFEMQYIKNINFDLYNGVNGDRLYPYLCMKEGGYALCLQELTAVYRLSPIGVSSSVSLNSTPSTYFKHACDDFYRYHERTGFPYEMGYMKASANYAMRYIAKHKDFKFRLLYEMTSRYNGRQSCSRFVRTMGALICTITGKILNKTGNIIYSAWDWVARRIKKQRFCSCIMDLSCLEDVSKNKVIKELNVPKFSIGNVPTTIADIFLFSWKDKLFAFYEYQNERNAKGLIYMRSTEDGRKWSCPVKVLEETVHLSFPSVFEDKGHVYMIPETSFLKEVRLYKSNADLTSFTYERTLLSGDRYVDSCVYVKNGVYYLFTSVQHDDNSYDLKLYYSDSLEGTWTLHPSSPLSQGKSDARNAGSIFEYNEMVLRPAQECRGFYGQNIHLFRIKELSKDIYLEEPYYLDLIPKGWMEALGGHQFSITTHKGKVYAGVDLLKRAYRAYDIVQTIKRKV